jgi:hypothetical protein
MQMSVTHLRIENFGDSVSPRVKQVTISKSSMQGIFPTQAFKLAHPETYEMVGAVSLQLTAICAHL